MITKSVKTKIKNYFLLNPTIKLRVRQIERKVKVPLPSAIRYSMELEQEGILKSEEIARIKVYSADRSSNEFLVEKKVYNFRVLISSNLINFLKGEYFNPAIILFGSFSRGEDVENSDIDLYLETPSRKKVNLSRFEKVLKRKIQLHLHKSIKEIKNYELANNIVNGITLNGFLEVFK